MGLLGLLTDGGEGGEWSKKAPLPKNLSHISDNHETCHSSTLKKIQNIMNHVTGHTSLVLLKSAFLHRKSQI